MSVFVESVERLFIMDEEGNGDIQARPITIPRQVVRSKCPTAKLRAMYAASKLQDVPIRQMSPVQVIRGFSG